MLKAKTQKPCPVCKKLIKISPYGWIPPHNSAIKKLNGRTCSASGKYLNEYREFIAE